MRIRSLFVYKVDNMAFNINAQVILSGPKNIQKVRSSISKQLSGVSVDVNLKVPKNAAADLGKLNSALNTLNATLSSVSKNATSAKTALDSLAKSGKNLGNFSKNLSSQNQKASKSLDTVGSSAAKAGSQLEEFGKDAALAVRRFSAFTIATGAVFGLVRAVTNATSEAVKFERELARVVQVTGATDKQLKGLTRTIDGLSTSLGIDANKLLEVSVTFAQTGQSIDQVAKSIKAVSRASLAATFGDIQKTTEGVIASLAQFKLGADRAEAVLGSLNAVSKSFAVEADDLISVIRRAGGVFAASSVQLGAPEERLRELIGIFTAVRSTTRESADTIATGLRTIFTRIQRPQTIKFLEQFGVQLRATAADAKKFGLAEGDFVGIFESLKRISSEIGGLDTLQLAKVVEELGGVRQVGKLLPALREFEKAERARGVALAGTASISKDVSIATKTLAVQIENLQQRFGKLIRDVSQSQTFQNIAKFAIGAANAVLALTEALKPALPLLTAFAGIKLAGAAFSFSKGFVGGLKKGGGSESVGANIGNLATGASSGGSGKQNVAAKQASDKLVIAALNKNTQATDKNTQALTSMSTNITTLNTTQSTLVTSANALSTQSTQLIAALNKLPAILLRGAGGGSTPSPIRRGPRRRANGGSIPKFAKGGFVNGPSHAQGGVIAELEGGEFVVPKKDTKRQGFATSGTVGLGPRIFNLPNFFPSRRKTKVGKKTKEDSAPVNEGKTGISKALSTALSLNTFNDTRKAGVFSITGKTQKSTVGKKEGAAIPGTGKGGFPKGKEFGEKIFKGVPLSEKQRKQLNIQKIAGVFSVLRLQSKKEIGSDSDILSVFGEASKAAISAGIEEIYKSDTIEKVAGDLGPLTLKDKTNFNIDDLFDGAVENLEGFLLEGLVGAYADLKIGGGQASLDFPNITGEQQAKLQNLFGDGVLDIDVGDAKRSTDKAPDLLRKLANSFIDGEDNISFSRFATKQFAAAGGRIGFENGGMVPVAISNGEGLVDAATASRIMPLLDRARAGDGSAIQALANQRNLIEDIVGPGTGTSDSIKTDLAAGSFVLQKSIMDRIDGQRQQAATGGVIRGRYNLGGVAAASGAIGTASQIASGDLDLTTLLLNLSFLSGGLSQAGVGLGNVTDKLKDTTQTIGNFRKGLAGSRLALSKQVKNSFKLLTVEGRRAKAARIDKIINKQRLLPIQGPRNLVAKGFGFGKDQQRFSPSLGRALGDVGKKSLLDKAAIANSLKKAKFTIGTLFASLLIEPVIDFVEKKLVGEKKRIGNQLGFTEEQGGAATASKSGAIRGAASGALTGAALGSVAIPIPILGTAIGTAAGAVIGGILGKAQADSQQKKFESVASTDSASSELNKALQELAGSGKSNVEALDRTTAALTTFTRTITGNIDSFVSASGTSFGERSSIPTNRIPTGGSAGFDNRAGRAVSQNKKALANDAEAIRETLASISDATIQSANKIAGELGTALVSGIDSQGLEAVSKLGSGGTFTDLQRELKAAGNDSELFAERLKALNATQAVVIRGLAKEQEARNEAFGKTSKKSKVFVDATTTAGEEFSREFEKSGDIKQAAEAANKKFASELKATVAGSQFGDGKLFQDLEDFSKQLNNLDAEGSDGINARLRFEDLAENTGQSKTKILDLVKSFKLFTDSASDGNTTILAAQASQQLLNERLRSTAQGVNLLVSALNKLEAGVGNAVGNFENSANNVKDNVSQILSTQQSVNPVAKGNVFNDPQATQKQIEAGVVRVQSATGGNVGESEGIAATISLSDQLPGAFKNVIDELKRTGKEDLTGDQFSKEIVKQIKGFDKIPAFIQNNLKEQFSGAFEGSLLNRQNSSGKGGVGAVQDLAESGGIEKLGEVSNKVRETFSKLNESVTKFDALILDSANLQVQSTRQLVDAQLKAADKTNAFADRFEKFRGGVTQDPLSKATQRLDQRVSTLLNKGNVQTNDGGDLLKRRSQLEGSIASIRDRIGQTTGTDKFDTATLAAFDDPKAKALISELANTTSALEGTKQAIDILANDTTELAAVEGKLASINEARLTGRQRLTSLFSQLANAKNPFDRKKILNDFQRPLVAAAKAQQGIPLSFQEFAALQSDLLQGVNGLLGTVEKNLFGRSDSEILKRIENLLASNQNTGIKSLQGQGFGAAGAVLGGAAATVQGQSPQEQKLLATADALLKRSVDLVNGVAQANADAIANQQQILQDELTKTKDVLMQLNQEFEKLRNTILTLNPPDQAPFPAATPPPTFAKGGVIYRANGGRTSPFDQFKKGTDTIPAMLSEGEFVMQKSAVDRIGVGNLNMLNNLSGPKRDRVFYAFNGGLAGAVSDTFDGSLSRVGSGDIFISSTNKQLEILAKNLIAANNAYKESSSSVEELVQKQKNLTSAQESFEREVVFTDPLTGEGPVLEKIAAFFTGESKLDRIKRDVDGTGISASDLERVGLVGKAEVVVGKAEGRRRQERQAQTNQAAIENRKKTGLGVGLFGSGTQETIFVTGRTKEQFENQNRGISESNLKSNIADATQLSRLNRDVSAIGFTRGKELQSELQQKAGGSGLGARVAAFKGGVARDPQRLTDRERSDARNRFTLKDLDKFENDLLGSQSLEEDFSKRFTKDITNAFQIPNVILGDGKLAGRADNFDTRQQALRQKGLKEAILPEENDLLLKGAIQGLENLKSNIEAANLSSQLLPDQQRAVGNINADEGVLGKIDEKLKVLRLFEKDLKPRQSLDPEIRKQANVESKARASSSLAAGIESDAKRLSELGDDTLVDKAEKKYREAQQKYQTALKDTIEAGGNLSKGSGDNVTELGKLFQERQRAFDDFKDAKRIQAKPTTPNENRQSAAAKPAQAAAKQQAAKDTTKKTADDAARDAEARDSVVDFTNRISKGERSDRQNFFGDLESETGVDRDRFLRLFPDNSGFEAGTKEGKEDPGIEDGDISVKSSDGIEYFAQNLDRENKKIKNTQAAAKQQAAKDTGGIPQIPVDAAFDSATASRDRQPLTPGSTTLSDGVTPLPRGMQVNENGEIRFAPGDSTSQDRFPIAGVAGGTEEPVQPNVNQATAKQQAASDTAGPITKRDAQRARSEARLNNPKASEGSQQAARRSLRDLDRKEREADEKTALNPKKGETLTPEMKERRRDAQISRSEKRLADGNLSEGGARAARTAKRDAERTKREANPATALNKEKGADVSTELKNKRRNAARQRYQDRLNDPTASAGKKSAARRGLRDLDRKENPLPTGNSESDRQARRDAQISRSDKRIADGNLSEGGAQAARRAKRDAERGNREADPKTALNPKAASVRNSPLIKERRRDAQTQRSTARLNDPTSSEGARRAARNALGLTREEAQAQGKLPLGATGSLGTQEGIYQGKPPSSIKKPDNLTFNQQLPTSKPSAGQQTTGPVQIQGAAELNQSLTQMTQVSQQLNAAADKLTNLPALEITINGKIAPVEVILNGTQMLADFKDSFSKELMPLIAEEIKRQKLQLGS